MATAVLQMNPKVSSSALEYLLTTALTGPRKAWRSVACFSLFGDVFVRVYACVSMDVCPGAACIAQKSLSGVFRILLLMFAETCLFLNL